MIYLACKLLQGGENMKIVFYILAILFTAFYALVMLNGLSIMLSIVITWIALFIISGVLLSKGQFWGGFLGVLPGIHLMYMSTKDTGQVINIELPLGVIVTIFYILCCIFVFYKKKKRSN